MRVIMMSHPAFSEIFSPSACEFHLFFQLVKIQLSANVPSRTILHEQPLGADSSAQLLNLRLEHSGIFYRVFKSNSANE